LKTYLLSIYNYAIDRLFIQAVMLLKIGSGNEKTPEQGFRFIAPFLRLLLAKGFISWSQKYIFLRDTGIGLDYLQLFMLQFSVITYIIELPSCE
jgi:hypothetical protein